MREKSEIFEVSQAVCKARKETNRIFNEIQHLRNDVYILSNNPERPDHDSDLVKVAKALGREIEQYFD